MLAATATRQLRPRGWARYFDAGFVLVWLAFWIVGEVVGVGLLLILLASAISAALGSPLALASRVAPTDGSVSVFVVFMLVWAALWTAGGVAAINHALRRLAGDDTIEITPDALRLVRRAGPFGRARSLARSSIRRVRLRGHDRTVVADTDGGTIQLTDLGTPDERAALQRWIITELELPDSKAARSREREIPPSDRDVEVDGARTAAIYPCRGIRRARLWVMGMLVAVASLGWIGALHREGGGTTNGEWGALTLTALVAAGTFWAVWGRTEWIVGRGTFRVRRRFRNWIVSERVFDAGSVLAIEHEKDSDGDDRYRLVVRANDQRRVLKTSLFDPYELAAVGEWVAARTGFGYDRTAAP